MLFIVDVLGNDDDVADLLSMLDEYVKTDNDDCSRDASYSMLSI